MDLHAPLPLGLVHVGYVVSSIEPAVRRFQGDGYTLEIEPTEDPIQGVVVAQLDDGLTAVELVSPLVAGDSPVEARLKRGGGLDHLCFAVPSVADAMRDEVRRGAIVVCEPVPAVAFQRTVGFVFRKSGLIVEYMSVLPV